MTLDASCVEGRFVDIAVLDVSLAVSEFFDSVRAVYARLVFSRILSTKRAKKYI